MIWSHRNCKTCMGLQRVVLTCTSSWRYADVYIVFPGVSQTNDIIPGTWTLGSFIIRSKLPPRLGATWLGHLRAPSCNSLKTINHFECTSQTTSMQISTKSTTNLGLRPNMGTPLKTYTAQFRRPMVCTHFDEYSEANVSPGVILQSGMYCMPLVYLVWVYLLHHATAFYVNTNHLSILNAKDAVYTFRRAHVAGSSNSCKTHQVNWKNMLWFIKIWFSTASLNLAMRHNW